MQSNSFSKENVCLSYFSFNGFEPKGISVRGGGGEGSLLWVRYSREQLSEAFNLPRVGPYSMVYLRSAYCIIQLGLNQRCMLWKLVVQLTQKLTLD